MWFTRQRNCRKGKLRRAATPVGSTAARAPSEFSICGRKSHHGNMIAIKAALGTPQTQGAADQRLGALLFQCSTPQPHQSGSDAAEDAILSRHFNCLSRLRVPLPGSKQTKPHAWTPQQIPAGALWFPPHPRHRQLKLSQQTELLFSALQVLDSVPFLALS